MTEASSGNVAGWFEASAARHGARPALFVDGRHYGYGELRDLAIRVARAVEHHDPRPEHPVAGLLAYRSATAYASLLGLLYAGKGYVPLNPTFPPARNLHMARVSRLSLLVVDAGCEAAARELLERLAQDVTVLLPDHETPPIWAPTRHRFVCRPEIARSPRRLDAPRQRAGSVAYVLFTSGSTGAPKGVTVLHDNVSPFVASMLERYRPEPDDRFSQNSDLTFDASVYDLFVCWAAGACLYPIPKDVRMAPARFLREHALTFWESVPSVIQFMKQLHLLRPGAFPSLRWSVFGGEQLTLEAARLWQAAAPRSTIDNTYGPTEATICVTGYLWRPGHSEAECHLGAVPIGTPFPGQEVAILEGGRLRTDAGARGELCLGGSQVTPGYWANPAETQRRFVELAAPGEAPKRWYLTGDLVLATAAAGLVHLGRVDRQLKLRGYRVELGEVEHVLRAIAGTDEVAVIPWPAGAGNATGLIGFVCDSPLADAEILLRAAERLPAYMLPQGLRRPSALPRNANGKVDFRELERWLETGEPIA